MAEYIYGRNAVMQLLKLQKVSRLFFATENTETLFVDIAKKDKVPFKTVSNKELIDLVKTDKHQGVVALIEDYKCYDISVIETIRDKENPVIVILDEVSDPQNFGAILRSADEFGVDFVIVKSRNQSPLNATAVKASAGAAYYVKVIEVSNISNAIKYLKDRAYWVLGLAGEAKQNIYQFDYSGRTALVFGNEGDGISLLVKRNCDALLSIPTVGHVGSLNVSVSVGIALANIKNKI